MRSASLRIVNTLLAVVVLASLVSLSYHRDRLPRQWAGFEVWRPSERPAAVFPLHRPEFPQSPLGAYGLTRFDHVPEGLVGASVTASRSGATVSAVPTQTPARVADKAVVIGRLGSEDTSWVAEASGWEPWVYTVDGSGGSNASLSVPRNKGREAMPYLTYILDNYDRLATTIAFVHSHRDGWPRAWHTDADDYSNVASLKQLRTDYVQQQGYVNLRCQLDPGCPAEIRIGREPKDPERAAERNMLEVWQHIMGDEMPLPDVIGVPCCAQFAVSAEQVRRRPRSDYERYRQWLLETNLPDEESGRVMEYLWHLIFGQPAVHCPEVKQCYCNVYGRC